MDQTDREFCIQDFKDRVRNILIATSVLARGLDIKHIQLVINYVPPNHMEDYVHRVGRTGRAGNKGTAITFITPDECACASDLIKALETAQDAEIPQALLDLDQLYHDRVADGDMEKKRKNVGYIGKGHKFTKEEEDQVKKERMELSKGYGFNLDENDEGDQAEELASEL